MKSNQAPPSARRVTVAFLNLPVPESSGWGASLVAASLHGAWRRWAETYAPPGSAEACDLAAPPNGLIEEGSDQALLAWLCGLAEANAASSVLVSFSLYLWNRARSAWLAAQLAERCPGLMLACGGPEIESGWGPESGTAPADLAAFRWGVSGPGEDAYARLVAGLAGLLPPWGGQDTAGSTGLQPPVPPLYRRTGEQGPAALHPWLTEGFPIPFPARTLQLETVRGCARRCAYCSYGSGSGPLSRLPEEQTAALVRAARERGLSDIYLMDPSLADRPDFDGFLKNLAAWNPQPGPSLHAELSLEDITPERARLLAAAGLRSVEAGLQSTNPRALAAVGRRWDRDRFEAGARALADAGVAVTIGVIAGLPYDGPDEIAQTIDYVAGLGLADGAEAYPLAVLPRTRLRAEAASLGIEFMPEPPWYLLQSPWIDQAGMMDALLYAEERWGREGQAPIAPRPAAARHIETARNLADLLGTAAGPRVVECLVPARLLADPAELALAYSAGRAWRAANPSGELRLIVNCSGFSQAGLEALEAPLAALATACAGHGHILDRLRHYQPDPQGRWSFRAFALLDSPAALDAWEGAGREAFAEPVADLAGLPPRERAAFVRQLCRIGEGTVPFVRSGGRIEPALARAYEGWEFLLVD